MTSATADSPDLVHWTLGQRLTRTPGEGPKAFRWKGRTWLISDAWKGLLVMRSDDGGDSWTTQPGHILAQPGRHPTDRAKGQHPDIIVAGDHAYILYPEWGRRTVIQIAELCEEDGIIRVDRDAPVIVHLTP